MSETPDEIIVTPSQPSEVIVIVEPPLTPIPVIVEGTTPVVNVQVNDVGLPGRDGTDGLDGQDAPGITEAILLHVEDETPHPVYDDGPSLFLLYQNAKV